MSQVTKAATLDEIKGVIKANIENACSSFNSIGYYLKDIRDRELFLQEGYSNVWELAQAEFGISKSSASRFMAINDKFSEQGNSPLLLEKYKGYSSSKLSEMLTLDADQLKEVTETTTVKQIRQLKNKKEEVVQEESIPGQKTIEDYPEYLPDGNHIATSQQKEEEQPKRRSIFEEYRQKHMSHVQQEIEDKQEDNVIDADYKEVVSESTELKKTAVEEIIRIMPDNKYGQPCPGNKTNTDTDCKWNDGLSFEERQNICEKCWQDYLWGLIEKDRQNEQEKVNTNQDVTVQEQRELPKLTNNDKRKDWIDDYRSWPVWIEVEQTCERYYRYDFDNGVSFVIKEHLSHKWLSNGMGYGKDTSFSPEDYYILGKEETEKYRPKNPTFYECKVNKSAMIEYLKELQKK